MARYTLPFTRLARAFKYLIDIYDVERMRAQITFNLDKKDNQ